MARARVHAALNSRDGRGRTHLGNAQAGLDLAALAMKGPDPEFALLRIADALRDLERLGAQLRRHASA